MWEARVAPLSGVVFGVLLLAGTLTIGNYDFMPASGDIVALYASESTRIIVGSYMGLLSAFALMWFCGSAFLAFRRLDDDGGRLSLLAFGGGMAASSMLALSFLVNLAGAERAQSAGSIDPGGAATLSDIGSIATGSVAPLGFAVLIGTATLIGVRSASTKRWISWLNGIVAVGLLSPINYLFLAYAIVWVPIIGVAMYRTASRRSEPVSTLA